MPPPDDRLIRAAEMLMHVPVGVSDRDMIDALQLQEVGPDFEALDGWEYYYIRSWAVAADDLGLILAYWEEEGIQAPEAWSWAFNVAVGTTATAAAAPRVCHIRYVGKCTGPVTPWQRLQDDFKRVSGLLPEFCTALNKFAPDVYEDVKVYEVHRARLQEHAADHIRDNRERALISFFGLPTLLNRQPGGFFASYVPSLTDQGLLESLGTTLFATFRTAASGVATTTTDSTQLEQRWGTQLKDWVLAHPTVLGTFAAHFESRFDAVTLPQSLVTRINGHVIAVLVGKDVTIEEYFANKRFLQGTSRAGHLTTNFLDRLRATEEFTFAAGWHHLSRALQPLFPFVDLYPWPGRPSHEATTACLDITSTYLQTVCPIIVVTFSAHVASCARANFLHEWGLSSPDFLNAVGMPTIQHCAGRAWLESSALGPPNGSLLLMIPHVHPGVDKYARQPAVLRQVLDLTWQLTLYAMNYALQLVLSGTVVAASAGAVHDGIVRLTFAHCNPASVTLSAPLANLYARLATAKAGLAQFWGVEQRTRPAKGPGYQMTATVRERNRESQKERVLRGEVAVGAPGSPDRMNQVRALYKLQLPDIFRHNDDPVSQRDEWIQWASALPQGSLYATHSLSAASVAAAAAGRFDPLKGALVPFAPDNALDDSWMNDPVQRQAALDAKGAQMRANLPADQFSSTRQRARRLAGLRDDPLYHHHAILEGQQVMMHGNGRVVLRWQDRDDGKPITLYIRTSKSLVPTMAGNLRTVHFLADGIGLRDETGADVIPPGRDVSQASREGILARNNFKFAEDGDTLLRLWTIQRALIEGRPVPPLLSVPGETGASTTGLAPGPSSLPTAGRAPAPPPLVITGAPGAAAEAGPSTAVSAVSPSPRSPQSLRSRRSFLGQGLATALVAAVGQAGPSTAPGDLDAVTPLAEPVRPGRPPFTQNSLVAQRGFKRPIVYADALWLLEKWLDTDYEAGGRIAIAQAVHWPDRTCITSTFLPFLEGYRNHPYYDHWKQWMQPDQLRDKGRHIIPNIRFLRKVTHQARMQKKGVPHSTELTIEGKAQQ
ncbi:hypothetical protein BDZ88DRAFT_247296 [Geranomyces variabilis]|nr:hypothetical protein BDZ88DRAFT_247296 [Geranomyces variabilis]KAJ3140665.1 hypothetical protein HDU90_007967 [Geranomyces variabilis]